jgi:hypothetical protein
MRKVGQMFGSWTIVSAAPSKSSRDRKWVCQCICGKIKEVWDTHIASGRSTSCGCLRNHGKYFSSVYTVWVNMKSRCTNPNNPRYNRYGGRGITICKRWEKFQNFYEDMGDVPEGRTLDRINNDGNYEPSNCRWATWATQYLNR